MPGKCLFSDRWLERVRDKYKAECKVCMKSFDVSNMGESVLTSHET